MNISAELLISLTIQLVSVGIMIGIFKCSVDFMQQQIVELKEKMEKYNNVLERLIISEQNIKAIWKKIDD